MWHLEEAAATLTGLQSHEGQGLSGAAAAERLVRYGHNGVVSVGGPGFWRLVGKQFEDTLVLILVGSAGVSFGLALLEGEGAAAAFIEPVVILLILAANAIVGVLQETNAAAAIDKLRDMEADTATVVRDGILQCLPAYDLVPGDIVHVAVGDRVPADIRLLRIQTSVLRVDESALTGESKAVLKQTEALQTAAVDQDKTNMLFSSALVTHGRAVGIVTCTGAATALGRIQTALASTDAKDEAPRTPLQKKLDEFGDLLSKLILGICVLVWVINIGNFTAPEHGGSLVAGAIYYFKIAVALAVAAIPEGLPAVVTTCLALGTMKMAKRSAIVRTLPSVETLGCTSVICSDKTGTITTNMMSVRRVAAVDHVWAVKGSSWKPDHRLTDITPQLDLIAKVATLCNDATLHLRHGVYSKMGDATEAALKVLAEKIGAPSEALRPMDEADALQHCSGYWSTACPRLQTIEFDRERRRMSVLVQTEHCPQVLVKGAPESILGVCSHYMDSNGDMHDLDDETRTAIQHKTASYTDEQLRCISFAYRDLAKEPQGAALDHLQSDPRSDLESDLCYLGVAGMLDPPRANMQRELTTCRAAGIRVVMVTGDDLRTAAAISRQVGLLHDGMPEKYALMTGEAFDALTEAQQYECVSSLIVFARVEPRHKQALVRLLQDQGEVVAMTGDGVNDAPALKKADIGVAMGSGTAVAKEASDMVLQNDDFGTIVMAVQEGRSIFQNTRQFIRYLISSNIGEVACIFFTAALGIPDVLVPVQLLWVNLVTDGLPATALGFNKPDRDVMTQAPRSPKESIVGQWMLVRYIVIGLYVGIATVAGFLHRLMVAENSPLLTLGQVRHFYTSCTLESCASSLQSASTTGLSILVTIEMLNAFNALSENQSLLVVPPWTNPYLVGAAMLSFGLHLLILHVPFFAAIFHVQPLDANEWITVLLFSAPVLFLDEALKYMTRSNRSRSSILSQMNFWARKWGLAAKSKTHTMEQMA